MNNTFKQWFPWAALFAVLAAVHLTCVSNELGGNLGGDNIVYFLLGKAIATGQGYVDLYLPGHPAHVKYPFLLPLLIAGCHLVFDRHVVAAVFDLWRGRVRVRAGRWEVPAWPQTGHFIAHPPRRLVGRCSKRNRSGPGEQRH